MATLKLLDIDYDLDFEVVGVVSSIPAYQLAWLINKSLKIDLVKANDITLSFTKKELLITNYIYKEEHSFIRIIKNKSISESVRKQENSLFDIETSDYFLPELKKYDFILQLDGNINNHHLDEVVNKLNTLEKIQLVTPIDLDEIKSKDNLIFE